MPSGWAAADAVWRPPSYPGCLFAWPSARGRRAYGRSPCYRRRAQTRFSLPAARCPVPYPSCPANNACRRWYSARRRCDRSDLSSERYFWSASSGRVPRSARLPAGPNAIPGRRWPPAASSLLRWRTFQRAAAGRAGRYPPRAGKNAYRRSQSRRRAQGTFPPGGRGCRLHSYYWRSRASPLKAYCRCLSG